MRIKTHFVETRVEVGICYQGLIDDEDLLDSIPNVGAFEPVQQQMYGSHMLDHGFIIFQGSKQPTTEEIKNMKLVVKNSCIEVKKKNKTKVRILR